jgi:hypothetical protein
MNLEEQSMKMEYFVVGLANLVIGALLFFAPISQDAPNWSKWMLATVCAVCGWLLWQRGAEEKDLWPLKFICWLTLIGGLLPLLYVPSVESVLEIFDLISSKAKNTMEDAWNLQRQCAIYGILAFCTYLVYFAFHVLRKGRKAWIPFFCGSFGFLAFFWKEHASIACLLLSIGFFRLFWLERYEHF